MPFPFVEKGHVLQACFHLKTINFSSHLANDKRNEKANGTVHKSSIIFFFHSLMNFHSQPSPYSEGIHQAMEIALLMKGFKRAQSKRKMKNK